MHRLRLLGNYAGKLCTERSSAPAIHRASIHAGRHALVYGDDVAAARRNGLPIVALESTIVTHGMPYPDNLNTALRVENAIRKQGVVPATIGIIDGKIHIGLNNEQLKILSKADPTRTTKCSRRDISSIVSRKLNGGTTVSATMLIAHAADIPIMATGGIGGVHRGAELTFDVSADLTELGRTPVAVVCSGVKSILDIGRTLEYLETQGVPVIKIGETLEFPAFYCSETVDKVKAPCRVSNAKEAAALLEAQRALGINTGVLFAVSIPEEHALQPVIVESAISEALRKANSMNVTGKRVTPFLLSELNEITSGQSLEANIALVENNARIAAEIASNLISNETSRRAFCTGSAPARSILSKRKPVVVGGAVLDTVLQVKEPRINNDGRTHAGRSRHSCGGVGRNVADALIKLGMENTRLISVVGHDEYGKIILEGLGAGGKTVKRMSDVNTARFTVIVDVNGECYFNVSEMESFAAIAPELIKERQSHLEEASIIVLDGNTPLDTMRCVLDIASQANVPVWYEPTDVRLAAKIFEAGARWKNVLHFVSPNLNELKAIGEYLDISVGGTESLATARGISERLVEHEHVPVVIATLGSQGVVVTRKASQSEPFYDESGRLVAGSSIASRLYPVADHAKSSEILSVSGCGDCLAAGIICGIHRNLDESGCVSLALKTAALSLSSLDAVPQTLAELSSDNQL
ncbi:pseudouridine-metabolizing bifunctional protein C1861.05 isoform X2 [Ooceraea biroi]|uniref:pseudouridine-metabolizing bifunctional protein C1861.05 isoform X2 n=1 Tax=Ooceraea biroi TaxID=2015173 RepID=UPI0005BB9452|nr:pseudouridine-metabolizing bifunctional protein C1861.05 isoform X2 [Ooceraea biroi]